MPRFFSEFFSSEKAITGEDARHISKVLRMSVGEEITVCDTKGIDYLCEITAFTSDSVELKIKEEKKSDSEPSVKVKLYQCMPKSDKLETVVQKATELGVSSVTPVLSSRCVSRPDPKSAGKKCERLRKIAESAAKQSGRGVIPEIGDMISFSELLKTIKDEKCAIVFYELGGAPLKELINESLDSCAIVIGPEGGFSAEEIEALNNNGVVSATLGKRILRTETAPLAAITAIMLLSGNLE